MNRKILSLLFAMAAYSPPKQNPSITLKDIPIIILASVPSNLDNIKDIIAFEGAVQNFGEGENRLSSSVLVYNYMKAIITKPFGVTVGEHLTLVRKGEVTLFTKQDADKKAYILKERFKNWDNPVARMAIQTGVNRAMEKYIDKIPAEMFRIIRFHDYPFTTFMTELILNHFPSSPSKEIENVPEEENETQAIKPKKILTFEEAKKVVEFYGKALWQVSISSLDDNRHLMSPMCNQILDRAIDLVFEHRVSMSVLLKHIVIPTPKEIKDKVHQAFMEQIRIVYTDYNLKINHLTWAIVFWANMCMVGHPNQYEQERILEVAQLHLDILSEEMSKNYQLNNEQFQKTLRENCLSIIDKYKTQIPEKQRACLDRIVPKLRDMQIRSLLSVVKEPEYWSDYTFQTWHHEPTYIFMQNIEEMSKNWIITNPRNQFKLVENREFFDRVKAYCQQIQNTSETEPPPENQFEHTIEDGLIKFPVREEVYKKGLIYQTAWLCQTRNDLPGVINSMARRIFSGPNYKPIADEWFEKAIEHMRDINEINCVLTPIPVKEQVGIYFSPKILPIVQKAYMDARTSIEHTFVAMMSVTIKAQDNGAIETQALIKAIELARTDLDYEMIAIAFEYTKNKEIMEKIGIGTDEKGDGCLVM